MSRDEWEERFMENTDAWKYVQDKSKAWSAIDEEKREKERSFFEIFLREKKEKEEMRDFIEFCKKNFPQAVFAFNMERGVMLSTDNRAYEQQLQVQFRRQLEQEIQRKTRD